MRALHHYEQVGLLSPHSRTESRHRLYDANDVRRLYQVCALRDIGVPLQEIRHVLDNKPSLVAVLRAHALRIEAEASRIKRLQALLRHALTHAGNVDPDDLLAMTAAMIAVSRRADTLQKSRTSREDAEVHWRKLADEFRACMKRRARPSSPRVLDLARQARACIEAFAGRDRATLDALAHLRRSAPPKNLAGWTPTLMKYLDRALTELEKE